MWYDYPTKLDYEISINVNMVNGSEKKVYKLEMKYDQATIYETIGFLKDYEKGDVNKWLTEFLVKYSNVTKTMLGIMGIDEKVTDTVFNTIKETRFRGVFGSKQGSNNSGDGAKTPYNSILVYLSAKLGIDPDTFQNKYTIEQMNYLLEGITYNANEQTDEGKEQNQRVQFNKENSDEDLLALIS